MNVKALMLRDLLPRSSFGTQEMQWFHLRLCGSLEFLVLTPPSCFTVIPSSPRQSGAATRRPSAAAITNSAFSLFSAEHLNLLMFRLEPSTFQSVPGAAFSASFPFNVISFSCLWALIAFSFFDNTSATSPSQNLLRHSALKSKHAESLQRRSHFNWLISIKEAFFPLHTEAAQRPKLLMWSKDQSRDGRAE